MATNPSYSEPARNWPGRGNAMSEEEYLELERLSPDRKSEYLDGLAYLMSGGSVAHDRITRNTGYVLDSHLLSGPCMAFGVDMQVLLETKKNGKNHYTYPDATVSCSATDRHPDNTLIQSPRVVVEVLSPGTEARDRGIKFQAYQNCPTIQEIILVSQFAWYIEIWQRNEEYNEEHTARWDYRHYGPGEIVEIRSIGLQVNIADIYRGLDFTGFGEENEV